MSVWKDKVRGYWRYGFQFQGKRESGWGFPTRKDANAEEAKHRAQLKKQTSIHIGTAFRDLANTYLDHAERNFVEKTYKGKVRACKAFSQIHGDVMIHEITPVMVKEVLDKRPTNNNYNVYRKELGTVFQYAVEVLEILERNPVFKLPTATHETHKKTMPAETDILKLIMAADPETDEKDLLFVLLYSLARIDEVLRLRWEDVNFERRVLTKWTRKRHGGVYEPIHVKINNDLYETLWRMWSNRKQETWVFFNEKTGTRYNHRPKFMKGICKRAGVQHMGFHTLRHYMATLLGDNPKIGTKAVQKILGHKSHKTTEIYIHSVDASVDAAMDSLDGKFTEKSENHKQTHKQETKKALNENAESL